jgi:hypothetical protein
VTRAGHYCRPDPQAVKLAAELIERESGRFEPDKMPDEYANAFKLLQAKVETKTGVESYGDRSKERCRCRNGRCFPGLVGAAQASAICAGGETDCNAGTNPRHMPAGKVYLSPVMRSAVVLMRAFFPISVMPGVVAEGGRIS